MRLLMDLINTNTYTFKKANKLIQDHHVLMYVGLVYAPLLWAMLTFAGMLPLFGGLVTFLAYALILSNYFYLIERATAGYSTDWQDIRNGFGAYMRKIFGILFIFWVANYGVRLFVLPLFPGMLALVAALAVLLLTFILFNALPEVIYKKDFAEVDSIRYTFEFEKRNIIEWYIPNILLIALNYGVWRAVTAINALILPSLPQTVAQALSLVIVIIVLQFTIGYTMLYRGVLFKRLDTTTRQKRLMQVKS
jgi:hypothetical protein